MSLHSTLARGLLATLVATQMLASEVLARTVTWTPEKAAWLEHRVKRFTTLQPGKKTPPPPAMSLGITINGELVVAKGYGEARLGQVATERTVYHIGSVTKQFTAAAMLDSLDAGAHLPNAATALRLQSPMREIFDNVGHWHTGSQENRAPITILRLLTMTSNLPNFTRMPPSGVDPWGAIEAPLLLSEVKKFEPYGWPNSFEYSNTGYFLLANILDAIMLPGELSPQGYRAAMRNRLFFKVGMTDTGFIDAYVPGVPVAMPTYRRRPAFNNADWLKGSADMASNVVDLHRWNTALMKGQIMSQTSRDLMFSDATAIAPRQWYGMGWFVEHTDEHWDVFSHSGTVPGYTSFNVITRSQNGLNWVSVSLLTNSDGVEDLDVLANDIVSKVLE